MNLSRTKFIIKLRFYKKKKSKKLIVNSTLNLTPLSSQHKKNHKKNPIKSFPKFPKAIPISLIIFIKHPGHKHIDGTLT